MSEDKQPYAGPVVLPLGSAVHLTMGSGEISTDYLGDPKTQYGRWHGREAEERDGDQPSKSGAEDSRDA